MTHAFANPASPTTKAIRPVEVAMFALCVAVGLAALALIAGFDRRVEWPAFVLGMAASVGLIAVGAYARKRAAAQKLALCAIGIGIFMGFSAVAAIFIFSLFPLRNPLIDAQLAQFDALFGYSWPWYVETMTRHPEAVTVLRHVYNSSLLQVITTILILGAYGREIILHRFLMVGILGMVLTISVWWLWPSVGPSGVSSLPAEVTRVAEAFIDLDYGKYLRLLVAEGLPTIKADAIVGVVGFPSYHMVMACMVVWFLRGTPFVVPAAVLSLTMIPAALLHGEHHLIDIFGGVALFAVALRLAVALVPAAQGPLPGAA